MACQHCKSERVFSVSAKCADRCEITDLRDAGKEHDGDVPRGLGIGGGDYIDFEYCLNCGRIQDGLRDAFPLPLTELENDDGED